MKYLVFIFVALILTVVVPAVFNKNKKTSEAWAKAADALGLLYIHPKMFQRRTIEGSIDGFGIDMATFYKGSGKNRRTYTKIEIDGHNDIPFGLSLSSEGMWSSIKRTFGAGDLEVGDSAFDGRVVVRGDEVSVAAVLDEYARDRVLETIDTIGMSLKDGMIQFETTGVIADEQQIIDTIEQLVGVAKALSLDETTVGARLRHNATTDSYATVRRNNLMLLLEHYRGSAEATTAINAGLTDGDSNVRLVAASNAGEAGWKPLRDLATSTDVESPIRTEALGCLVRQFPTERSVDVVERLLDDKSEDIRRAAITQIGSIPLHSFSDRLSILAADADHKTAAAIAWALGRLGVDSSESTLIELLAFDSDDVRTATAKALGMVGTVQAVEPLLKFTKGLLTNDDLKQAARTAISDIQLRLGDADGGRLSLAGDSAEDGALSLAHEGGGMSIVNETHED